MYGNRAEEVVDAIFKKVDKDGSGEIDYTEWVIGTIDKKDLLTENKLKIAFKLFDKDGGGSLTAQEIKDVIFKGMDENDMVGEDIWDQIVAEVDEDGSGEIEFDEFCVMM